jgi:[ribosomal protein S18]-alanine N-acetyltransferase
VSAAALRFFEPRDIPAILQIQSESREAAQWSQSAYERLGGDGEGAWIAERDGRVDGFLIARAVAGEMEILNLAVQPTARRMGVGTALLREALSWAVQERVGRVFLEVRFSNVAATRFYEQHGFAPAGVRANYYRDPVEDTLLLALRLAPSGS